MASQQIPASYCSTARNVERRFGWRRAFLIANNWWVVSNIHFSFLVHPPPLLQLAGSLTTPALTDFLTF